MKSSIRAVLFDVFGTAVDWRSGLIAGFSKIAKASPGELALAWHENYIAAITKIRLGDRPWVDFDILLRESLDRLLEQHGLSNVGTHERESLISCWFHFRPWEDVVEGLERIKRKLLIAPLSNGHVALLTLLSKHAGLPWDLILSAELFHQYKTHRSVYTGACALLRCEPGEVLMVASHQPDLDAAREAGLRTAFVHRPREFGEQAGHPASGHADMLVNDFLELAKELGL